MNFQQSDSEESSTPAVTSLRQQLPVQPSRNVEEVTAQSSQICADDVIHQLLAGSACGRMGSLRSQQIPSFLAQRALSYFPNPQHNRHQQHHESITLSLQQQLQLRLQLAANLHMSRLPSSGGDALTTGTAIPTIRASQMAFPVAADHLLNQKQLRETTDEAHPSRTKPPSCNSTRAPNGNLPERVPCRARGMAPDHDFQASFYYNLLMTSRLGSRLSSMSRS